MNRKLARVILSLLTFLALLTLAACGGKGAPDTVGSVGAPESGTQTPESTPTPDSGPDASAQVGDIFTLGGHEWRVLEVKDRMALAISERILEEREYNADYYNVWKHCTLRHYLNTEFFDDTFSDSEKTRICATAVTNANRYFELAGGHDTTDKIFLLSHEEVVQYFGDSGQLTEMLERMESEDIEGISDQYNDARTAYTAQGDARGWWLRSAGDRPSYAALIGYDGLVDVAGTPVEGSYGVRPALWLSLEGPAPTTSEQTPPPVTYVTKEGTFALDIPDGLAIQKYESDEPGDHLMMESLPDGWQIDFYENVPSNSDSTFAGQRDIIEEYYELIPITIAGKEGYYYLNDSAQIHISVIFPNPTSDDENAISGSVWIMMEPIEGYETEDYLEIPQIKNILASIRVPE